MTTEEQGTPGTTPAPRRHGPNAYLLGSAILICGMIIGGAVTFLVAPHHDMDRPGPSERMPERIVERLRHDLKLTDDQAKAALEIFQRNHEEMEVIRAKVDPEVEASMEKVRIEVEGVLNPEQKVLWNKRCREMRERMRPHPGKPAQGSK